MAVPAEDAPAGFINPDVKLPTGVRKIGTHTGALEALAAWLKECGVTTVAMESTGVYWVSWLGLCPQHRGSSGEIFNRRVRRGAHRAARALRMAAQGCHHAKNVLGAFYRRVQARCGGAKAVVATARKIAERV